jgi:hypothetical protein
MPKLVFPQSGPASFSLSDSSHNYFRSRILAELGYLQEAVDNLPVDHDAQTAEDDHGEDSDFGDLGDQVQYVLHAIKLPTFNEYLIIFQAFNCTARTSA